MTNDGAPLLALAGASVRFGSFAALEDVDVQVRRGEFVALVGSNGSGKTTLLHALHGLLPLSGRRDVDAGGVSQAMVFQRPFMLRLSVLNNLRIALWLAGVPAAERTGRAREALQRGGQASAPGDVQSKRQRAQDDKSFSPCREWSRAFRGSFRDRFAAPRCRRFECACETASSMNDPSRMNSKRRTT